MDLVIINLIDGFVFGLLLFMLSAGLTLIFSMMGVLNFAHASFYILQDDKMKLAKSEETHCHCYVRESIDIFLWSLWNWGKKTFCSSQT